MQAEVRWEVLTEDRCRSEEEEAGVWVLNTRCRDKVKDVYVAGVRILGASRGL